MGKPYIVVEPAELSEIVENRDLFRIIPGLLSSPPSCEEKRVAWT